MTPVHAYIVAFDTLAYAKKLENSGISQEQAEAHTEALVDILDNTLDTVATKSDIKHLETTVDLKISKIETKLSTMQTKIILWVVGLLSAQTTVGFALNKLT